MCAEQTTHAVSQAHSPDPCCLQRRQHSLQSSHCGMVSTGSCGQGESLLSRHVTGRRSSEDSGTKAIIDSPPVCVMQHGPGDALELHDAVRGLRPPLVCSTATKVSQSEAHTEKASAAHTLTARHIDHRAVTHTESLGKPGDTCNCPGARRSSGKSAPLLHPASRNDRPSGQPPYR